MYKACTFGKWRHESKIEPVLNFKMTDKMTKNGHFRDLTPLPPEMLHHKAVSRYFSERHYRNINISKIGQFTPKLAVRVPTTIKYSGDGFKSCRRKFCADYQNFRSIELVFFIFKNPTGWYHPPPNTRQPLTLANSFSVIRGRYRYSFENLSGVG